MRFPPSRQSRVPLEKEPPFLNTLLNFLEQGDIRKARETLFAYIGDDDGIRDEEGMVIWSREFYLRDRPDEAGQGA